MDLIVDFPQERPPRPPRGAPPGARVSWASHVETRIAANLSLEYRDRLWFTAEEMHSFRLDLARTLRGILSSGMSVGQFAEANLNESSLFLGLEGYLTEDTPSEIRHRRRAICEAVICEQFRQWDAGIHDPEAISTIAEQASEFSRKRARIVGLLHAPEAQSPAPEIQAPKARASSQERKQQGRESGGRF